MFWTSLVKSLGGREALGLVEECGSQGFPDSVTYRRAADNFGPAHLSEGEKSPKAFQIQVTSAHRWVVSASAGSDLVFVSAAFGGRWEERYSF